jgi:hypothetical protein
MVRHMQLWNDFLTWLNSVEGWRIVSTAILPFLAIIVAGVVATLIGRRAVGRVIAHQDRELQAAAVTAMIEAGRSATKWSSLLSAQQAHVESQSSAADIRLRLLPVTGATAAADWAAHELADMRKNSAGFSFQADQTFVEFRDRLLEWQRKPARARKLFALDLERFRYEDKTTDAELVDQQRLWAAEEAATAQEQMLATNATPVQQPSAFALQSAPPPVYTPTPTPAPVTETVVAASFPTASAVADPIVEEPTPEYDVPTAASSEPVFSQPEAPQPDDEQPEFVEPEHSEPEFVEPARSDFSDTPRPYYADTVVQPEPVVAAVEPEGTHEDLPEPVAAPEHVNAGGDDNIVPESEPAPETAPAFTDEDRNEDDPVPENDRPEEDRPENDQGATQALPLSYFDPVPQRPPFPVSRPDNND